MNIRPVLHITGILVCTLAAAMLIPMLVDLSHGHDDWQVFFFCALATAFFGGIMAIGTSGAPLNIQPRQGFLMISLIWILLSLFSAMPFWLSEFHLSFTDSVFEAVSGITTTGGTVIVGLDSAPPGLLIWRAMLQWLGGIGVILMAMSIMPFLKVGGMQLFQTELSENEKAMPRLTQLANAIGLVYVVLTLLCVAAYGAAGMNAFDAFAHALTTISTGGFSTYDTSFAHYHKPWLEIVAIIFMILGGLPFVLYLKTIRGNGFALFRDSQVRWFIGMLAACTLALVLYLTLTGQAAPGEALRRSLFNVVSVATGTGYANGDYGAWGSFPIALMFFLMVVGACAGSTSCGIKIFRFQVLYSVTQAQIRQLLHPHGVFIAHYNGRALPEGVATSVMSFFFIFGLSFAVTAAALSFVGLDFITALSASATALANVGPGLGDIIGPAGTFAPLPDAAKWILSIAMLTGRLEIFTLLVLFTPAFWRR